MMNEKFTKAYKIWAKFRDITLPILLLWIFIIAPNIHKPNALQEILKSLSFFLSIGIIVFLPVILLTLLFLKRFPEFTHNKPNQHMTQPIVTKSYQWLMIFLVAMLGLIFSLSIIAIKFIQYFELDGVLLNY